MAWACMAASRTDSLIFIEFRSLQEHSVCQYTDKCIRSNQEELRGEKWKVLDWPSKSPDLNIINQHFTSEEETGRQKQITIERSCAKPEKS